MSARALPASARPWLLAAARPALATAVLLPWLALVTSWQTALYPAAPPAQPPVPPALGVAAIAAAAALRAVRRSTPAHVLLLAAISCGVALLAAQPGTPIDGASGDYCGDFCRHAILGRAISFGGWPIATSICLSLLWRRERARPTAGSAERAAWSLAWAAVTLVLGSSASVAWWRVILPNG